MNTNRNKLIAIAEAEIGTKEEPANSNKQKYGEWYEWNAVAWCAIFVSWCYHHAGFPLPKIQHDKGFAYCPYMVTYAKKHKLITVLPAPGDIVMFDWDGDNRSDHTGIFKKWLNLERTKFECIEGNTSPTNQSNGGAVMLRIRNVSQVAGFINMGLL